MSQVGRGGDPPPLAEGPAHDAWLAEHGRALLAFGRAAAAPGGGGYWLTDDGAPWPEQGLHTWITARTVHVHALGALLDVEGCRDAAGLALAALLPGGRLADDVHGGWYAAVDDDGAVRDGTKAAYAHAFVVLATCSAVHAGLDGATALLAEATATLLDRFWDEERGLLVDAWDVSFTELDPYRGLNATMHGVEAMLSAADVTGDPVWLERAARIGRFVIDTAAQHAWRLPEHYDDTWVPDLGLNADRPDDPFKPYGTTVGHGLEWARLLLHLEAARADTGLTRDDDPDWAAAAAALYDRAVTDGWAVDGAPGFVYTTDWAGTPVVRTRMHWVAAEAVGAAATLLRRTGEERYAADYDRWWAYCAAHLIDERGSWHHELDPDNVPGDRVWPGRADVYHAYQATLVPRLPLAPAMVSAVAAGLLGPTPRTTRTARA